MSDLKTRDIVYGGLTTGIIIIFLYFGNYINTNKLFFLIIATYISSIPYISGGTKIGLITYFSSGILSVLLIPNKAYSLIFIIFGIYPFVKGLSEKKVKKKFEFLIKYAWLNISFIIGYVIINLITPIIFQGTLIIKILIILGVQILFYIYDYIFTLFISIVMKNLTKLGRN